MAKEIWYPEEGDTVQLANGKMGTVTDESPVSMDEGDWQIEVQLDEPDDPEDELVSDVEVKYDETRQQWKETE